MARSAKFPPAFSCFRMSSALAFAAASVFASAPLAHRDQDVTRLHLLWRLVLIQMRLVVGLRIGIAHRRSSTGKIRGLKAEKFDLAGLGNGVRIVRGVALEEGLQIGVRGIDGALDVRP